MIENIRLAFQGIWSHKMRSFLTMLGIIIGIASIISIVSTIKGTNEQIKQNLIGSGNNNVNIMLKQGDWIYEMDQGVPQNVQLISEEQKEEIRNLDGAKYASFYQMRSNSWNIFYGNTSLDGAKVLGVDRDYLKTCGYVIYGGRNFLEEDYTKNRKVLLLNEKVAQSLFQNTEALGQTLEISGEPFTIVGIFKKSESFQPVINNLNEYYEYTQNQGSLILMPDSCWPIVYQFDEPQECVVMAKTTDDMRSVGTEAAKILNRCVTSTDSGLEYKAEDLMKTVENIQNLSESTNKQLLWIASISLLVGGIGVMNIMLVSVTERTSEIGLKKAVGARKRRILAQFLTEAAVLTSIGGVIGVVAGIVLAQVISKLSSTPVAISVPAIAFSVVFSMAIGILFGLLPSVKAAKLNPIDALRHE